MIFREFVLGIAYAHKKWAGADTALVVDSNNKVIQIGEQSGAYTYDTPIVNILQNVGVSKVQGAYIYCTYVPGEMDLGMACMRQVARITCVAGGALRVYDLSDESGPVISNSPRPESAITKRPDLNGKIENPGGNARWSNTSWVDGWFNWVDSNRRFLVQQSLDTLNSYHSLENNAWKSRPAGDINTLQGVLTNGLSSMESVAGISGLVKDRFYMLGALALVGRSWSSQVRANRGGRSEPQRGGSAPGGHNVGAILLDSSNKIIAWGINMMGLNGTFHAETGMILAYLRRNKVSKLPDGCRLYTTLQPCHMCSGFIATVASNIHVVIGQADPKISNSALAKGRGIGISESLAGHTDTERGQLHKSQWNLGDILEDLIKGTRIKNAIPFLYSNEAAGFFQSVRTRPEVVNKVVTELCRPASLGLKHQSNPVSVQLGTSSGVDILGRKGDLLTNSLMRGPSRTIPLDLFRQAPRQPSLIGDLRNIQSRGGETVILNASRNVQGLDLAVTNMQAHRLVRLPNQDMSVKALVNGMSQIQLLLSTLKNKNVIQY